VQRLLDSVPGGGAEKQLSKTVETLGTLDKLVTNLLSSSSDDEGHRQLCPPRVRTVRLANTKVRSCLHRGSY